MVAKVIRQKAVSLEKNDALFIGSSHTIGAQGNALFEYLELLGSSKSEVLVHAHAIFTPRDYLHHIVLDDSLLRNGQCLLEAFLSFNNECTVISALDHLWHSHPESLSNACHVIAQESNREPGSFWFARN